MWKGSKDSVDEGLQDGGTPAVGGNKPALVACGYNFDSGTGEQKSELFEVCGLIRGAMEGNRVRAVRVDSVYEAFEGVLEGSCGWGAMWDGERKEAAVGLDVPASAPVLWGGRVVAAAEEVMVGKGALDVVAIEVDRGIGVFRVKEADGPAQVTN